MENDKILKKLMKKGGIVNKRMKKGKMIKKEVGQRGITLVALVITIIIMLILAGVTLRIALSENGLFRIATQSSETTKDVAEEERVKLAVSGAFLDGVGTLTKANVKKALENEFGILEEGQLEGDEGGPWTFTGKRKVYEISSEGSIGEPSPAAADLLVIDTENKTSPYVKYIDKNNNPILCKVLYDKKYNEDNNKNYGIQIVSVRPIGKVLWGSKDDSEIDILEYQEISGFSNIKEGFWKLMYSYNNIIGKLNDEVEKYRNEMFTDSGGARPLGSLPENPRNEGEFIEDSGGYIYDLGLNGYIRDYDDNYIKDWNQLGVISSRILEYDSEFYGTYILCSRRC